MCLPVEWFVFEADAPFLLAARRLLPGDAARKALERGCPVLVNNTGATCGAVPRQARWAVFQRLLHGRAVPPVPASIPGNPFAPCREPSSARSSTPCLVADSFSAFSFCAPRAAPGWVLRRAPILSLMLLGGLVVPPGHSRQIVQVYTPLDFVSATVDGNSTTSGASCASVSATTARPSLPVPPVTAIRMPPACQTWNSSAAPGAWPRH